MGATAKLQREVKSWMVTYEVEHYTDHDSYIETVTNDVGLGRHVSGAAARGTFWRSLESGCTPNGILMENVKGIRILHLESNE
jgi:hypothetical protein